MIEVTGLVRQADLSGPGGVSVGGVRIGGGPPQAGVADPRRNMGSMDPVIDVESWRPLAEPCPNKPGRYSRTRSAIFTGWLPRSML